MIKDLILKNRSYRRYYQNVNIGLETIKELIELARLSASGANFQPLKFIISNTPEKNSKIFPHLAWAGYLKDWVGPVEGERPSAYIIILGDTEIRDTFGYDPGIACQSILLGAVEKGFGGCMLASIQREKIREILNIPSRYEILLVLALGKPKEIVVIDNAAEKGDIKYWRDDENIHHVPKRPLDEIIIG